MKLHNLVNQQFSATANNYFESSVHASGQDLEKIKLVTDQLKPKTFLDLGCGGGHVSFTAAPYAESIVAYDLSQPMIDLVARVADERGFDNIETKLGTIENISFPDGYFDLIVSRFSAHHWADVKKGLSEVYRVLKPNGQFILVDVVAPPSAICDTTLQTIEILRDLSHVRDYSLKEWNEMLAYAGFKVNALDTWKLALEFDAWVKRIETPLGRISALREVIGSLPSEAKNYFEFDSNDSFKSDSALFETSKV